jgi:transposase
MHAGHEKQGPEPAQLPLPAVSAGEDAAVVRDTSVKEGADRTLQGRRYRQGLEPAQPMLLPPSVDDYVGADNPVRAIAAYVDTLDLAELGLKNAGGALTAGQPAYDPADLLKLYLYGYLNRVRSSRRLEAECLRNLELMWLLNGLRPNYHTIADFRKDNAAALKAANREFVQLCRELGLFGGKLVGIDGSFFNGNASDASVKTKTQLQAELKSIERDIERYQQDLQSNDGAEQGQPDDGSGSPEKLAEMKARAQRKSAQIEQLEQSGETQVSRTDPDARRLSKNGKKVTGYNVQSVVEDEHKLILTHEVTNAGNDLGQLVPMAEQAKQELQVEELEVLADAGYYTESDIAACEQKNIVPYVPVPDKQGATNAEGRLPASAFRYDAEQDVYICPGERILPPCGKPILRSGVLRQRYRSSTANCKNCPLRSACLSPNTSKREIHRSEHAEALERHRQRMDQAEAKMGRRSGICEHPFGTMKRWLGWDHFLVRGFEKVRGEMALLVNCYNLRRVLSIFGVERFIAICEARRRCREEAGQDNGFLALLRALRRRLRRLQRPLWRPVGIFPAPERSPASRPALASAL